MLPAEKFVNRKSSDIVGIGYVRFRVRIGSGSDWVLFIGDAEPGRCRSRF